MAWLLFEFEFQLFLEILTQVIQTQDSVEDILRKLSGVQPPDGPAEHPSAAKYLKDNNLNRSGYRHCSDNIKDQSGSTDNALGQSGSTDNALGQSGSRDNALDQSGSNRDNALDQSVSNRDNTLGQLGFSRDNTLDQSGSRLSEYVNPGDSPSRLDDYLSILDSPDIDKELQTAFFKIDCGETEI